MSYFERVFYYGMFVAMFIAFLSPGVYDSILFFYYAIYDFGSSADVYIEDHWSGWTVFVFISFVLSTVTQGFYTYILFNLIDEINIG